MLQAGGMPWSCGSLRAYVPLPSPNAGCACVGCAELRRSQVHAGRAWPRPLSATSLLDALYSTPGKMGRCWGQGGRGVPHLGASWAAEDGLQRSLVRTWPSLARAAAWSWSQQAFGSAAVRVPLVAALRRAGSSWRRRRKRRDAERERDAERRRKQHGEGSLSAAAHTGWPWPSPAGRARRRGGGGMPLGGPKPRPATAGQTAPVCVRKRRRHAAFRSIALAGRGNGCQTQRLVAAAATAACPCSRAAAAAWWWASEPQPRSAQGLTPFLRLRAWWRWRGRSQGQGARAAVEEQGGPAQSAQGPEGRAGSPAGRQGACLSQQQSLDGCVWSGGADGLSAAAAHRECWRMWAGDWGLGGGVQVQPWNCLWCMA